MLYLSEPYYFFDKKRFPFKKAVLATAKKVSEFSWYYKARLISPLNGFKEIECQGNLPPTKEEKHKFIEDLIKWIFSNSATRDLFTLFLDDQEITQQRHKTFKFDHPDDTCCWVLNLTEKEFQELKTSWKSNGLPEDLFYPEGKDIKIIKRPGLIKRLFNKFGFTFENVKIYSPKRWDKEKRKEICL